MEDKVLSYEIFKETLVGGTGPAMELATSA